MSLNARERGYSWLCLFSLASQVLLMASVISYGWDSFLTHGACGVAVITGFITLWFTGAMFDHPGDVWSWLAAVFGFVLPLGTAVLLIVNKDPFTIGSWMGLLAAIIAFAAVLLITEWITWKREPPLPPEDEDGSAGVLDQES
jgi:hypothetical protein